jgi:UDP-glucose 6-dehydrogenase
VKSIFDLLDKLNPQYLIISANYQSNKDEIIEEVYELINLIDNRKIKLFVGGSLSEMIKHTFEDKISIIDNMHGLMHKLNKV